MLQLNISTLILAAVLGVGSASVARPLPKEFTALNQFGEDIQPGDFPELHPKKGGSLRLTIEWQYDIFYPETFKDEKQVSTAPFAGNFVFEPLMWSRSIGFSETITSGIVRSVSTIPGEPGFILHVQDGVTFSDDTPVTAEDVVRSYEYARDHMWTTGSKTGLAHQRMFGDHVDVRVLGPMEVYVRFAVESESDRRRALYTFLGDVQVFKPNGEKNPKVNIPNELIGTGPYILSRAERTGFTLARRANYWEKTSALGNFDEIKVTVQLDQTMGRMTFSRGDSNFWVETSANKGAFLDQQLESHGRRRYDLPIEPISPVRVLYMNQENRHLKKLNFRKAMLLALDDETMEQNFRAYDHDLLSRIRAFGDGGRYPVTGTPSPEVATWLKDDPNAREALMPFEQMGMMTGKDLRTRREHLKAALDLLTAEGYRLDRTVLKDPRGKPVTLRLLAWHNAVHTRHLFTYIENLRQLGIEIQFREVSDDSLLIATLRSGDFDFFNGRLKITRDMSHFDPTIVSDNFLSENAVVKSKSGFNVANWQSPAVDRVLKELERTDKDQPLFNVLTDAFLRLVSANVPVLFMGDPAIKVVYVDKHICVPPDSAFSAIYFSYWDPDAKCEGTGAPPIDFRADEPLGPI